MEKIDAQGGQNDDHKEDAIVIESPAGWLPCPRGINPVDPSSCGHSSENKNAESRSRPYIYAAYVPLFSNSRAGFAHAVENIKGKKHSIRTQLRSDVKTLIIWYRVMWRK